MTNKLYKIYYQLTNYLFILIVAIILIQCNFNHSNIQGDNSSNFDSTPINPPATSVTPPLHLEAEDGDLEEVRSLLQNGGQVNATDDYGVTALHLAYINGHLDVVQELLQNGADINVLDGDGCTPLYWAAQEGKLDLVNFLLERGADGNLQDHGGHRPLERAIANNHLEAVKILVESESADERD